MKNVICKALDEHRLAYKVLNQNLQACGGGTFDYREYLPTANKPGKWLPELADPEECIRGWHFTLDPLSWPGCVVFLVEVKTEVRYSHKQAFSTGRLLKRIWHDECLDVRLWVRINSADLNSAYLNGVDLSGADLRNVDLRNAYLRNADLRNAYLRNADLRNAYLGGADLRGADLGGAYLRGADLRNAYLGGADLRGADLGGADLEGAYLSGDDPTIPGWRVGAAGRLVKA